ncbi:hypothetical protein J1614_005647 [Plenodomus biglobosus]|nr:hypothetical protein J1614_005647 [Plenodomus biglobosus]
MSTNIIPASVAATGPQFQVFPNEILLEVIKYALIIKPGKAITPPVEARWFPFIWAMGVFRRMRHVSKTFNDLAIIAFYQGNEFLFNIDKLFNPYPPCRQLPSGNIVPALLPPIAVRHDLRHITINLVLEDFYYVGAPRHRYPHHSTGLRPLVTVAQLFQYSASARQLRDLTRYMRNLEVLNLILVIDFRGSSRTRSIALFKAAAFSVRANKVTVVTKDREGDSEDWHSSVAEVITVE